MDKREAAARQICGVLRGAGHRALFAGGCVRDRLLGLTPKDYDIATSARAEEVARLFDQTAAVGAAFGVMIVVRPEGHFEVATFRKDGPYSDGRRPDSVSFTDEIEDAKRRDFTVNALFFDPETDAVLDYAGGRADLEAKVLRTVGEPAQRFAEDYLRLLRAVRFAARLDYALDGATREAIIALAPHIQETSAERVRDELLKMLTEGNAARAIELLDETGLLEQVLPEITAMKGVEQPAAFHPEGGVYVHTLLLLSKLDAGCSATLALGALLHDVGKPATQTFEDRIRFNLHHKVGARMAEQIMRRLRFSNAECERVTWLVDQHMRVADIPDMRESKRKRFVREDGFAELLALCKLDCLSSHGGLDIIDWITRYVAELKPEEVRPEPLLRGAGLLALGYKPGPRFGEILRAVEDAQLEGAVTDADAAREFVARNFPISD